MAILSWGKPTVEIRKTNDDGDFTEMPAIVENTAKLAPTKGTKTEATQEGGETVDVRYAKNKFAFECEVFVKKGDTRPIEDEDGIVKDNYSVRLTPEDPRTEGFIIDKSNVVCEETWSGADGKKLKYTFDGIKPLAGNVVKPYPARKILRFFSGKTLALLRLDGNAVIRFWKR